MKVLITSDIHINDFRSFNILGDPLFRLHQFDKLSQRLIQIIEQENVKAMCIAGDFLHVASPRPYIVNAAGRFLKNIAKTTPIFVTHGQHDYDSRTVMSEENSLLSLYNNIDNVQYLHKQGLRLDNRHFFFQGWTPEQDFSGVKDGVFDVLIGHATINTATMNDYGTQATGVEYEHDKFKICFMGDIHYPQVRGNQVVPGVPFQNNFGDSSDNSVIILDTYDLSWKRVPTETPEFRFLKFLTTDVTYDDPFIITKPKTTFKADVQKESLTKSVDIVEVIDKYVKSEKLTDIHEQSMSLVSKLESDEVDLFYTIDSLELVNFRSVEHVVWTPSKGVTLIQGTNGTGKSSLVEGIRFALLGATTVKDFVRIGQSEMSATIVITYGGLEHKIIRGFNGKSGYTRYLVQGNETESEKKRAVEDRIKAGLPFLLLYKSLHRDQDTPRFLGSQTYAERVDLMSKVIGLSLVAKLKKVAEDIKTPLSKDLEARIREQANIQHTLASLTSLNLDIDNEDYNLLKASTQESLTKLGMLEELQRRLGTETAELEKLHYALGQYSSYNFDEIVDSDTNAAADYEKKITDLGIKLVAADLALKSIERQINMSESSEAELLRRVKGLEDKKSKLVSHTCFTCSQPINKALTDKLQSDITNELTELRADVDTLRAARPDVVVSKTAKFRECSTYNEELMVLNAQLARIQADAKRKSALKQAKAQFTSLQDKVKVSENTLRDLESKWTNYCSLVGKKVNLPITSPADLRFHVSDLNSKLATYNQKQMAQTSLIALRSELKSKQERLAIVTAEADKLKNTLVQCDSYIALMSATGAVIRSVLTIVSENLSDDRIKVIAFKTLANGETRPDFSLYLKVADEFINYEMLSGGQKNVCDIFILKHLIDLAGGAGSLVFDETFSQVDTANLEYTVDILKHMKVNHTLIISHHENFPHYDAMISTNFNDHTGVTTYNLPK